MAGKFEPKVPVQLDPPKDDPISVEELAKANGVDHFVAPFPCRSHQRIHLAGVAVWVRWSWTGLSQTVRLVSILGREVVIDKSTLTQFPGEDGGKCYVAIKVGNLTRHCLTALSGAI